MAGPWLIAVMGETASGKSELAEELASALAAQLINADSFQVYRGMDIGTAKSEAKDRYHLIDIRNPDEGFTVGEFVTLSHEVCKEAWERRQSVVVVGGTGLNIRALFEEYQDMHHAPDPALRNRLNEQLERNGLQFLVEQLEELDLEAYGKVDLANPVRVIRAIERAMGQKPGPQVRLPAYSKVKFSIDVQTEELNSRIENRVRKMVHNGWASEIERLREQGYRPRDPGFRAIGYRQMWDVVEKGKDLSEAIDAIVVETRQYAKRQRTWLRSEPNLIRLSADPEVSPFRQAMQSLSDI